jgi:ferric-dicitrate binding protein FerR (iron transport regulator)
MKRIQSILALSLILAIAGFTTLVGAAGAVREMKATVRAVHGDVQYKQGAGEYKKVRPNDELPGNATIKTGPNSNADLIVNGRTSTVRIEAGTEMTLEKMEAFGPTSQADSQTTLNLHHGDVLGSVRKLSAASKYQVATPNGVAGIRGTDFQVSVTISQTGIISVTITSVTGTVVATATINVGANNATAAVTAVERVLTSGQAVTFTSTSSTTTVDANGNTIVTGTISVPDASGIPVPFQQTAAALITMTTIINTLPPPVTPPQTVYTPPLPPPPPPPQTKPHGT